MITIVDYGMGNVRSIYNMLSYMDIDVSITCNPNEVMKAEKIILPGVGSFDAGMTKLRVNNLEDVIKEAVVVKHIPLLGICLGMQMLGKSSEEGIEKGLALIDFETKRFRFADNKLKVPHMGWDLVNISISDDPLVFDLTDRQRYYFVHSFHAVCTDNANILMQCDYGYLFTAAIKKATIYGVQFHPEKSHKYGMQLLKNFAQRV